MGKPDSESKEYMRDKDHFADLVNYYVFGGEQVVEPDTLKPLDTTEITIPYGNGVRVPIQRFRDLLKLWSAMIGDEAVYVIFGDENQADVNYAMPVKSGLYDFMNYANQVTEARNSRKNTAKKENEKAAVLTSGEFLSGFRKGDRLMPVITLVVYFGSEEWDGPVTIHEMLNTQNEHILNLVQDYKIHLIAPAHISDEDFDKFRTDLGAVLQYIKYSNDKDKLDEVVRRESRFWKMNPNSVALINAVTGSKLKFEVNKEGKIDMCKAIDEMRKESRDEGKIEGHREGKVEGHREGKIEGHREGKIEGHREGKIEGSLETLSHLVQKGVISVNDAAQEANLSPNEFTLKMKWFS